MPPPLGLPKQVGMSHVACNHVVDRTNLKIGLHHKQGAKSHPYATKRSAGAVRNPSGDALNDEVAMW
ncbi:hypothetical protein LPB72_17470 [Hydrogenophaga crassostreae]|uniref:Uncharacterized protein n=1 Tax=Hydrogenophaga crassostreae TaxID=1763535 RepID=A0A167GWU5_9BURK|nr:hypothetical protein LPB072_07975 [Hydrogenophaga crassostreae]OAD39977.1 hypothetical protein LPB72_17470 [Hydrogenophaga crassostreae]